MATYYVDPVSGNDANAGTSFVTAWATTQKALDTVGFGDEVRLCATGTETLASSLAPTFSGSEFNPVRFVGYDATGTTPLTRGNYYTISGSSLALNDHVLNAPIAASAIQFNQWWNVRFTGARGTGCGVYGDFLNWHFRGCRFDNNGDDGLRQYEDNGLIIFDCDADNNGGNGFELTNQANRGDGSKLYYCRAHNNGGYGIDISDPALANVTNCLIYRNTGGGIRADVYTEGILISRCTIANNSGDGIYWSRDTNAYLELITENIIALNSGYGINHIDPYQKGRALYFHNLIWNNTTGGILNGTDYDGSTSDPKFVDQANDDYSLASDSPAKDFALDGGAIGAIPYIASSAAITAHAY